MDLGYQAASSWPHGSNMNKLLGFGCLSWHYLISCIEFHEELRV